jgi:hypothetical protein
MFTVAAPAYLARAGESQRPEDLDAHRCLSLKGPHGRPHAWLFKSGPRPVALDTWSMTARRWSMRRWPAWA